MHEETPSIANFHTPGTEEYFDEIFNKKRKSQPINFDGTLWETLDQKPKIGNLYFMNSFLFQACKSQAVKEVGGVEEGLEGEELEEAKQTRLAEVDGRTTELYYEKEGEVERFDIANYVKASSRNIQDLTFQFRQLKLSVLIVSLKIIFFPVGLTVPPVPVPIINTFITRTTTFPQFTENYERMTGQIHSGPNLTIDTTRILNLKDGTYLVKAFSIGKGYTTNGPGFPVGIIEFAGLSSLFSLNLIFSPTNNLLETPLSGFGFISEVDFNNDQTEMKINRKNWSISDETQKFQEGKIESEELSLLAQETLSSLDLLERDEEES
tara:strand:- start:11217 stop:12185 length:969 start_codon:yes stop_codon:yes gene_type:complete